MSFMTFLSRIQTLPSHAPTCTSGWREAIEKDANTRTNIDGTSGTRSNRNNRPKVHRALYMSYSIPTEGENRNMDKNKSCVNK